jgi:arsenite methyltransferase
MEHIPLPDDSVDVIISNCVINLSGDKDSFLREGVPCPEARRTIRRFRRHHARRNSCGDSQERSVVGWLHRRASDETEYRNKLRAAGFENIDVEPTCIYSVAEAREFLASEGIDAEAIAPLVNGKFMSAFVRAVKPSR